MSGVVAWLVQHGDENFTTSSFVFDKETADAEKAQGGSVTALVSESAVRELVKEISTIAEILGGPFLGSTGLKPSAEELHDVMTEEARQLRQALAPFRSQT